MSNKSNLSTNVVVIAAAAVFCFFLAAIVALVVLAPSGTDVAPLMGQIFTGLGGLIAAVGALVKVGRMETSTRATDAKVTDLTNGLLDAKVRAAVADVLPDDLIRPEVGAQLDADRARRAQAAEAYHGDH